MQNEGRLLTGFIKDCFRLKRILWSYHINLRISGRFISRDSILKAADQIEIIESYSIDKCLPSYLVLVRMDGDVIHMFVVLDVAGDNIQIMAAYKPEYQGSSHLEDVDDNMKILKAYKPDPGKWLYDMKTRRPKQ